MDILAGKPEVLPTSVLPAQSENIPQGRAPILIEESVPEAGERSLEALKLGEEARTTPPPATSSRGPFTNRGLAFVRVSLDASPHYERLRRKRPAPSTAIPLTCEGHSFFEDLPSVPEFVKSFYNELFASEGDIFEGCSVGWSAFRSIIISGPYDSVCRLEKHMIMDVPREVLEDVVDITASAARMSVRVDGMHEVLDQIASKKRHLDLLERTCALEDKLLELDRQRDEIT